MAGLAMLWVPPRRWTSLALAIAAAGFALVHQGTASFLVLLVLAAVVLAPSPKRGAGFGRDALAWSPVSVSLFVAALMALVIVSGLMGMRLWADGVASWTWAILIVVTGAIGFWRGGRVAVASGMSLVAWAPAAVLAAIQVWRMSRPMAYWSRPIWDGTDWMNHADMVLDLQRQGLLDFAMPTPNSGVEPDFYPRGLHAVAAWVLTLGSPANGAFDTWSQLLQLLTWVAIGIAVLTFAGAGLVACALALRLGLNAIASGFAALLVEVVLVYPSFYQSIFWWGFVTTAGVAVVLFAAMLSLAAQTGPDERPFALIILLTLTFLVFNLWQLMALPLIVVDAYLLWKWWRSGRQAPWLVFCMTFVTVALCAPLGRFTFTAAGSAHVTMGGRFPQLPWWLALVVGAALACGGLLWRRSAQRELGASYLLVVGASTALGFGLYQWTRGAANELLYYPAKVLWHAVVLGLPGATACAIWGARWAWSRPIFETYGGIGRAGRLLLVGGSSALLVAFLAGNLSVGWAPSAATLAGPGGVSPQVAMTILRDPDTLGGKDSSVLVWKIHPQGWQYNAEYEDAHANQIARSLGHVVPDLPAVMTHASMRICQWLAQHPDALRITGPRHGERDLLAAGCPESVVQSQRWRVLMTPDVWWVNTEWVSVGGDVDPNVRELGELRYLMASPAPSA